MKLLFISKTSNLQQLKFGIAYLFSRYTLLVMRLFIQAGIKVHFWQEKGLRLVKSSPDMLEPPYEPNYVFAEVSAL